MLRRFALLSLALIAFGASIYIFIYSNRAGGSFADYLHQETPEHRRAREDQADAARLAADKDYAARLRADGLERAKARDYENAKARFDEAAAIDPEGDAGEEVGYARNWIRNAYLDETPAR